MRNFNGRMTRKLIEDTVKCRAQQLRTQKEKTVQRRKIFKTSDAGKCKSIKNKVIQPYKEIPTGINLWRSSNERDGEKKYQPN